MTVLRRVFEFLRLTVATAAVAVLPTYASAEAAKPVCQGQNILAELAASEPEAHAAILAQAELAKNAKAMLWRVSRAGIPDSYLLGTAHMTDPRVNLLSPTVKEAVAKARVVALEIADISPMAMAEAIAKSPQLMLFEDDRRLDLLISPEAFAAVKVQLEAARLPSAFASRFKPWVVSMVMAISECERKRMADGHLVLDMVVAKEASDNGVPVVGLETIEGQLSAAAAVPMEEQVALLRASLSMADRTDDLRETVLQLYVDRKLGAALPLQQLIAERSGSRGLDFRGFKSKLVDRRNRLMRTHALPLLSEGNVFIAVGGLHLIGEEGLVELLRNAGYELTPIE